MSTASYLLPSLLVEELDAAGQGQDGLLQAVRADDVLQVLQHAVVVLRLALGLHHGYLLHLTLRAGGGGDNTQKPRQHTHKCTHAQEPLHYTDLQDESKK